MLIVQYLSSCCITGLNFKTNQMKYTFYVAMACVSIAIMNISCRTNTPMDASEKITMSDKQQSMRGKVLKVIHGTDGYTAVVRVTDGNTCHMTASIPNCGKQGVFKSVEVGDSIYVRGEVWMLGIQRHMTVRTFLQ